jgi:hypothetical protein
MMEISRHEIERGYEPVSKIDTNIMASRNALLKMGFPPLEVGKIEIIAKERKHFVKRLKALSKLSQKGKLETEKSILADFNPLECDICGNSTGLGIAKLTAIEQEAEIPSGWALVHFGSYSEDGYRAYIVVPPGIVIDYRNAKIYIVCGNCQLLLELQATESGILIHNIVEGTGYGFVDLDRIEKLIRSN